MTRLEKINQFRIESNLNILKFLPDLSQHCEECGTRFSRRTIDFGRCDFCGNMICSVNEDQIRAWENEK